MSAFLHRIRELAEGAGGSRIAIEDDGARRTFAELYAGALRASTIVAGGEASLAGRRVMILASPGAAWVEAFLGVLCAGGVALPLSPLYPDAELVWFAGDAEADLLVVSDDLAPRAAALAHGRRVLTLSRLGAEAAGDDTAALATSSAVAPFGSDTALLLYTSGTTGKPKGAMITHDNLATQARLLREAWGFSPDDALLHALPLHHLHGLGISLMTALLAGARSRMLPRFEAARVWDELAGVTVWMAVPTMYQKLFEAFDAADAATRPRRSEAARALRLATSGSAALPVTLAERWRAVTGAIPLERFGMTEIGVGMTNPLAIAGRRPGYVGRPLPTVELRLVDDAGQETVTGPGEAWIRGPSVFPGYWRREKASAEAFTDGWFRTGDVAERAADGAVRLLGRTSVDILKSGGYKLSALEIEEALREHEAIAEVSVVGVPDETWGERVVAVVVARAGRAAECATDAVRAFARARLAPYKIPRQVVVVEALPRNAVGKVTKPALVADLAAGRLA